MVDNNAAPLVNFLREQFHYALICPMDGRLQFTNAAGKTYTLGTNEDLELVFHIADSAGSVRQVRLIIDSSFPTDLHKECCQ
jgi:hypothetical protein